MADEKPDDVLLGKEEQKKMIEQMCDFMPAREAFARIQEIADAPRQDRPRMIAELRLLILRRGRPQA